MFKISTSKDAVKESGGSSFINSSGVYDVTIKFASVNVSAKGAESVAFNVEYNGNTQTFYGPYYQNTDGKLNEIGAALYNKLGIIAGMAEGDEFDVESEEHAVGKDNKVQEFAVIQQFTDLSVKMHVVAEYSIYNSEIQERFNIRAFFREDGATADEIINDGEVGKQLATVLEKYANNVTYKDGLTEEDVAEWKAARASGNKTPTPKKTVKATTTKGSLFAK